jgi:hypothetical protein
MTTPTFTLSLIRELRGSPLTVLMAILLLENSGQVPITAQLLKDVTGFRDHTITDSLHALSSPTRQIVTRVHGGWRLTRNFQLPLEIQDPSTPRENRDIRGFQPVVNSINRLEENTPHIEDLSITTNQNRDIRGFNQQACLNVGIYEPKASSLASLPWATPEYITAWAKQTKAEGQTIGLTIWRIEHHHPQPHVKPDQVNPSEIAAQFIGHELGCSCLDCQIIRSSGHTRDICPDCHHYHCECP